MAGKLLPTFLVRLSRRENLNRDEAAQLLEALLDDDSTDAQIAAILVALALKGETAEELAGMVSALRKRAVRISCRHVNFIDTAGTGSSAVKTFNISTASAFVIAGAGLPVAKHGNRAASSRSGSADVLSALGVNIQALPHVSENCLTDLGICFMFAPLYHGAAARVASVRRELGIQTTFNLLGPLSNPASAPLQIIGVWRRELVELLATVLDKLGTKRAWVVHGEDGLDEITLNGSTVVAEIKQGSINRFSIRPEDFGFEPSSLTHLRGGDPETNAKIISDILSGTRRDAAREIVLANAAAALMVANVATDLHHGVQLAEKSIDSGSARKKLDQLIEATN